MLLISCYGKCKTLSKLAFSFDFVSTPDRCDNLRCRYLIQFRTHRKRLFRRRGFGLRHAALAAGAFILIFNIVSFSSKEDKTDAAAPVAAQTAFVAPQPNIIEPYAQPSAENAEREYTAAKPQQAAQAESSSLAKEISSIQGNISKMLEASSNLLVSQKKVVIGKGDTLMDLLVKKAAVPRDDAYEVVQALSKIYNPRDLNPGREITVFFHKDPSIADPQFSGMRIEKDIINFVTVNRDDEGHFTVNKQEKDVHRSLKGFKGTISNSLYADAQAQGVPDAVILDLIKMYSWNVDFQREIQSGDKFEVMYEEYKTEDNKVVRGKGNIVYAKLTLSDNEMPFYRYEDKAGTADYYDNNGRSAKKPLMKTPIDGARLSSGFGMRRHPVLGYSKMHKGVDFAAPRGTPIYAAGDGTIQKIGPFSSYGNYVRIRHRAGLETAYAHMKGFKSGLRVGSRIKQGEIIGYVGTTGRSTGPHLHYEILVNNTQVNPSSVKMPTGTTLKGKDMKAFKTTVASLKSTFSSLSRASTVVENTQRKTEKVASKK